MNKPVNITITDGLCHIELNRPEQANAINISLAIALRDAAEAARAPEVKSILLTGTGARFCAGGDLASIASNDDTGALIYELATVANEAVQTLENLDKPIVAAVHGSVAGAGLAIMLSADVIYASPETKFVFAYPNVGLTPDCGASALLPAAMGMQRALAFALSGRPLSVEKAEHQGLVTSVVDNPHLQARETATAWATGASTALGKTRALLRGSAWTSRAEVGRSEAQVISHRAASSEAQQLMSEFMGR